MTVGIALCLEVRHREERFDPNPIESCVEGIGCVQSVLSRSNSDLLIAWFKEASNLAFSSRLPECRFRRFSMNSIQESATDCWRSRWGLLNQYPSTRVRQWTDLGELSTSPRMNCWNGTAARRRLIQTDSIDRHRLPKKIASIL